MQYEYLSRIYDKLYNSEKHLTLIDEFFSDYRHNRDKAKVLDIGCGTGRFLLGMYKRGWEISGLDLSKEMLTVAEEKFKQQGVKAKLYCRDMRKIGIKEKFDLVTSNFDSLNYILSLEELCATFHKINNIVLRDGFLAFDMISEFQCKTFVGERVWEEKDFKLTMISTYEDSTKLKTIKLIIQIDGEEYVEEHLQRGYDLAQLRDILEDNNFRVKNFIDIENRTSRIVTEKTTRAYYIAQKI